MEQINRLRGNPGQPSSVKPEEWIIRSNDAFAVRLLVGKEKNTCDVCFFYNRERVGSFTVQDLGAVLIYPYAQVAKASDTLMDTKVFFDMSSSKFKVSWTQNMVTFSVAFFRGIIADFGD